MAVVIFLCCLLGGIAIGLPIAWSLLLCGAALMTYLDMFDVQIMRKPWLTERTVSPFWPFPFLFWPVKS